MSDELVPVEQVDRDAAESFMAAHWPWKIEEGRFISGELDQQPIVQAFARHRHRLASAPDVGAELVAGLEFNAGDLVEKPRGYPFPGKVVAAFMVAGGQRFVVESELAPGMLHIFSPSQLRLRAAQGQPK